MTRRIKLTETELAKIVILMLKDWGWEVYQEVAGPFGRCDIVGKREKILWGIECKINFGLPVIEQALHWKGHLHYISVAVKSAPGSLGKQICSDYGIGILSYLHGEVQEELRPKLIRKITPLKLQEEQKIYGEAGSNSGGHWTNFKRTVRNLVNKVNQRPGIEFNELIKEIDHHYASYGSAKSCLRGFIGTVIPEIRIETINNKLCVFPVVAKRN